MRDADARAEDRRLVDRCFAHDRAAWDSFVERFNRLIYGVVHETLRRHGGRRDEETVDDLFHAAFLALYDNNYRRLRQWSGRCSLASWVRLVTSSIVIDELRRRRSTTPIDTVGVDGPTPESLVDGGRAPFELLADAERAMHVRKALLSLGAADRELLLLLFRDDHSPAEAARLLGVAPGALYTRKNRALQRLREAYEALPEEGVVAARGRMGEIERPRASMDTTEASRRVDSPNTPTEGADGHSRR